MQSQPHIDEVGIIGQNEVEPGAQQSYSVSAEEQGRHQHPEGEKKQTQIHSKGLTLERKVTIGFAFERNTL